jgi:hypothetical protein
MLGGYRNVFAALAGLALVGAGPEESKQPIQGNSATETQKASETIAAAIRQTISPTEKDGGCQNGSDKRDSDLCAQWKAADAARDAANYALWTLLLSGVGTGLLIWTLWETRQTAMREQRAYIRTHPDRLDLIPEKPITVIFLVHNYGSTPARSGVFSYGLCVRPPGWIWDSPNPAAPPADDQTKLIFHPGDPGKIRLATLDPAPPGVIDAIMNGQAVVYGRGTIFYTDVFRRKRKTSFQFEVHGADVIEGSMPIRMAPDGNDFT